MGRGEALEQETMSKSRACEAVATFLAELPHDTAVAFTDGSALENPGKCGAGAAIYFDGLQQEPLTVKEPISVFSTSYHGEMLGLVLALTTTLEKCETLIQSGVETPKAIHILCDCKSALMSMTSSKILSSHHQLKEDFIAMVKQLQGLGVNTLMSWVAGHVNLPGNDLADACAKEAAAEASNRPALTRSTISAACRRRTLKRWRTAWKHGETGRTYQETHPEVSLSLLRSSLPTYLEAPLLRLRTFSTNLNGDNLWKAARSEEFNPACECGSPRETAEHVVLECNLLRDQREQMVRSIRAAFIDAEVPMQHRMIDWFTLLGGEKAFSEAMCRDLDRAVALFLVSSGRDF